MPLSFKSALSSIMTSFICSMSGPETGFTLMVAAGLTPVFSCGA